MSSVLIGDTVHPKFPREKGNLILRSVDNVVFHVDRSILENASGVFGAAKELSAPRKTEDDCDEGIEPIKFEADAKTLELLLLIIDNSIPNPDIPDIHALASLLRAAKRYQMDGIFHLLTRELYTPRLKGWYFKRSFTVTDPLVTLAVAYAFECPEAVGLALREVIKGDIFEGDNLKLSSDLDMPLRLFLHVQRLRQGRFNWLKSKMAAPSLAFRQAGCCMTNYLTWRDQLFEGLQKTPTLEHVKKSLNELRNCTGCSYDVLASGKATALQTVTTWEAEYKALDEQWPELPQEVEDAAHGRRPKQIFE